MKAMNMQCMVLSGKHSAVYDDAIAIPTVKVTSCECSWFRGMRL